MNNDQRILDLKDQIKSKKEELITVQKKVPVTNCSLDLEGKRYNLHTLNKNDLKHLSVKLNMYKLSAKDLGYEGVFLISGYDVKDWLRDIKNRLDMIEKREKKQELEIMEKKLESLLSNKKKVEIELDEIESLLGDK